MENILDFKVSRQKCLKGFLESSRCLIFEVQTSESLEGPRNRSGGVAQLGEHLLCKQGVIGSIPFISTKKLRGNTKPHKWAHSSGG